VNRLRVMNDCAGMSRVGVAVGCVSGAGGFTGGVVDVEAGVCVGCV